MDPQSMNFWSISLKESLLNSDMHLELGFPDYYCVQMKILMPGTIGRISLKRKHTFLTTIVLIISTYSIEYNESLEKYGNIT